MYEFLLTIHLLAVAIWIGGALALNVISARTPPAQRGAIAPQLTFYGERVITGSAVVALLAGGGLVAELDLSFSDTWIALGLAIWLVTMVIGGAMIGPTGKKLGEEMAKPAPDLAVAAAHFDRITLLSRIDTALVIAALVVMVTKPGA